MSSLDVAHDALLELAPLLLALLQQHLEGGVALVEDRRLAAQGALRAAERLLHDLLLGDVGAEQEVRRARRRTAWG